MSVWNVLTLNLNATVPPATTAASSGDSDLLKVMLIAIPNIALILIALIQNAKQHKKVENQLTSQIGKPSENDQPLLQQTAALATQQTQIANNVTDLHVRLSDHLAIEISQRETILTKIEDLATALNDHIVAHRNDPEIKGLRQSVDNLRERLDAQGEDMNTLMNDIAAMRKRMDSQERRVQTAERKAARSSEPAPLKDAKKTTAPRTTRPSAKSA